MQRFGCSQRNALRVLKLSPGTFFYKHVKKDETVLKARIKEITDTRVHYGYRRHRFECGPDSETLRSALIAAERHRVTVASSAAGASRAGSRHRAEATACLEIELQAFANTRHSRRWLCRTSE